MRGDPLLPDRAGRGRTTENPTPPPNKHVWKTGGSVLVALSMLKLCSRARDELLWGLFSSIPISPASLKQ